MNHFSLLLFTLLVSSGYGQVCRDVANTGNFYVEPGSRFCVNCPIVGAIWFINNTGISNIPSDQFMLHSNNSLVILNGMPGNYQCRTDFTMVHMFMVELAVDAPPFTDDPTTYNVSDNARITCESGAVPAPVGINWRRNGMKITEDNVLQFQEIARADAGVYMCCAISRVAGELVTTCSNITITVQYQPAELSISPTSDTAQMGGDHMISCSFDGVPTPNVLWSHDGNVLVDGSDNIAIATVDSSSTLTISTLIADDAGNYTCEVSNLLGNAMASSMLRVQVPPDPPTDVMVTTTTTTQISLSWTNPFDGLSPITMVMVTYQLAGSQPVQVPANTITSHTIDGLLPNMVYSLFLRSRNAVGLSGFANTTAMTDPLPPGLPSLVVVAESSTSIRVSWTFIPAVTMTPVYNWTLHYRPSDGSDDDITPVSHDANVMEDTLTELNKGTEYFISVAASNSAGLGPFANDTVETLIDPPSEPTNLMAEALSHSQVRVTWEGVIDNGGRDVVMYHLRVNDSSSTAQRVDANERTYTFNDLMNSTNYIVEVAASNMGGGIGSYASVNVMTLEFGIPPQPSVTVTFTDTSILVMWGTADSDVTEYLIQYRIKATPDWSVATNMTVDATMTSYTITGLRPELTYEVRVFALNNIGMASVASEPETATTTAQLPVKIEGDSVVTQGGVLNLTCLLMDGTIPYNPQWTKDSNSLANHVMLVGINGNNLLIDPVQTSDAGLYTCTNLDDSTSVTVNITRLAQSDDGGLDTLEYVLIGIGGIILFGIVILVICIICVCCVRYHRRPTVYSPGKGSNWIDGEGHTGIVFMASSYSSTAQSPTQREHTTDAPYLGCEEEDFHNASTFNTLERSAIHRYDQTELTDLHPYRSSNDYTTGLPHKAHYAELDLPPPAGRGPPPNHSVHYAKVDKSSFKRKYASPPPPGTQPTSVPVAVVPPTAAAASQDRYRSPTYNMPSYHYPVTPGDTVV